MVEILRKGTRKEKIKEGGKEKEACVWHIKSHEYGDGAKISV